MDPKRLKSIFSFFEKNTEYETPLKYKFIYDQESLTKEDLNVKGNLNLIGTNITSLPDNLEVGGNLGLSYSNIDSLPKNLKVKGNLFLGDTPLAEKYTRDQIEKMVPLVRGIIRLWN